MDAALQDVNNWFRREVEQDPAKPGRMAPDWYAVMNDLALFLGEVMIERSSGPCWEFGRQEGRRVPAARIIGFTRVPNPKYNIDPGRILATYGHRIVAGQPVENDAFWQWVMAAESKA